MRIDFEKEKLRLKNKLIVLYNFTKSKYIEIMKSDFVIGLIILRREYLGVLADYILSPRKTNRYFRGNKDAMNVSVTIAVFGAIFSLYLIVAGIYTNIFLLKFLGIILSIPMFYVGFLIYIAMIDGLKRIGRKQKKEDQINDRMGIEYKI